MANRKRRSDKTRLRIFLAHGGRCHVCSGLIGVGEAWDLDHVIPLALFGDDEEHNLAPAHRKGCHGGKTASADVPAIAQAKRREMAHLGAKQPARSKLRGASLPPGNPAKRASTPLIKQLPPRRSPFVSAQERSS